MKRNYPFSSEDSKNGDGSNKQWCSSSTSSNNSDQNSTPDSPTQNSVRSLSAERSDSSSLPTTTSPQPFPWMGASFNRGSELFNADSSQNPYMMPFGRNCAWPDNRMFGMPIASPSIPVNSSAMPLTNTTNLIRRDSDLQASSTDPQKVAGRSPSPLPTFSAKEVEEVNEMLKEKNTLRQGLKVLTGWLKRGDCTKSTNNDFTDMIKYAHNQVWRLMSEKTEIKEEFNEEKREFSKGLNHIATQFEAICKVLEVSQLQKVWDHFTKPQRKQLVAWREENKQIKSVLTSQEDDEEDINDDDIHRSPDSSQDLEKAELMKEHQKIKEQLDCLQNQVLALENETDVIMREKQEKVQEQTNSVSNLEEKCLNLEASIAKLKKYKTDAMASIPIMNKSRRREQPKCTIQSAGGSDSADRIEISQREVFLITLISTFLYVHPFGASLDYICSYLISFAPYLNSRYLENLLTKFPKIFKEKRCGIGASLSRSWYFMGFKDNE